MAVQVVLPVRTALLVVTLLIASIVIGLLYLYLPHARIVIHPKVEEKTAEQTMVLSANAKEPDFVRFILPVKTVKTSIQKDKHVQREGASSRPDFAKGTVTLTNNLSEPQDLLPKTHLKHQETGIFFLTDKPVRIPANGSVSMSVTAKEVGSNGNVAPGRFVIDKLPASTQAQVYAESNQQFSGGLVVDDPLSGDELSKAVNSVIDEATKEAQGKLTLEAGGAGILPSLIETKVISQQVSAGEGSKALAYDIHIEAEANGFVVNQNDLVSLALLSLRSNLPSDKEFVSYNPASFMVDIARADFSRGEARATTKLTGSIARKIEPSILSPQNLAGLTQEEIIEHFKKFESVGEVEVHFSPFWVRSAPSRTNAIEITIANNQ